MIKFLKNKWPILTIVAFWLPITFYNTKIYWMLVDDGGDVVFARTLFEKFSHLYIGQFISQLLETGGRFRPIYWFYHTWVWLIGGNSFQFQHFAHMIVIGITVLFIYLIVHEISKSKVLALFASFFYFFVPLNTENIMRLGPQEPLMAMFFAIFFYLVIKTKKIFLSSLMLALAVFTKETALAILPIIFIYYLYEKKNSSNKDLKISFRLLFTVGTSALIMILITFLRRSGYSTNYSFDAQMIMKNIIVYFRELTIGTSGIFPFVPSLYLLRNVRKIIRKQQFFETRIDLFEFLFFGAFLCFLVIQLPWAYALTRYLMPAILFLTLFMFLEIYQNILILRKFNFVKKHSKSFTILSILLVFYTMSLWWLDVVLKESSSASYQNVYQEISKVPQNTVILMNMAEGESTMELVYEIQVILNEFWDRRDIRSEYLDMDNLPDEKYIIIDSAQFIRKYPKEELIRAFGKEFYSTENVSRRLVLTTPLELIKQSLKKVINAILYKKEFSPEGIYTYYQSYSNWYFFNEK